MTELKQYLEERGIKHIWLAQRAHLRDDTLSRIINGLHPSIDQAHSIAQVLNESLDRFWPGLFRNE